MCSRHTVTVNGKQILVAYNLKHVEDFEPNYNVAITQETPVITAAHPDEAQNYHFGLVPWFSKTGKMEMSTSNARNDQLMNSNLWKPLMENCKTCLVLTTGFIEFKADHEKPKEKDPYLLKIVDREIYAMAGLYSIWEHPETKVPYKSYAIITTDANPLMQDIHWTKMRQPFILQKEQEKLWLDNELSVKDRMSLISVFPEEQMISIPLSRHINKVSTVKAPNNDPHLLDPVNSL